MLKCPKCGGREGFATQPPTCTLCQIPLVKEMITSINGQPAPWSAEIDALFHEKVDPRMSKGEVVTHANYFTPRPYVDEYNRGSDKEGFVYTLNERHVCFVEWRPVVPCAQPARN